MNVKLLFLLVVVAVALVLGLTFGLTGEFRVGEAPENVEVEGTEGGEGNALRGAAEGGNGGEGEGEGADGEEEVSLDNLDGRVLVLVTDGQVTVVQEEGGDAENPVGGAQPEVPAGPNGPGAGAEGRQGGEQPRSGGNARVPAAPAGPVHHNLADTLPDPPAGASETSRPSLPRAPEGTPGVTTTVTAHVKAGTTTVTPGPLPTEPAAAQPESTGQSTDSQNLAQSSVSGQVGNESSQGVQEAAASSGGTNSVGSSEVGTQGASGVATNTASDSSGKSNETSIGGVDTATAKRIANSSYLLNL